MSLVRTLLDELPEPTRPDPEGARLGAGTWFPELPRPGAYLNHAAVSPPSSLVRASIEATLRRYARLGVGAIPAGMAQRARLKTALGRLIGGRPEHIGLSANTTHGVQFIAQAIPWRAGQRLLCLEGEFPTNVLPWRQAAEEHGLELNFEPLGPGLVERIEARLRQGLRLVALSAVQFRDGQALPLERLAGLCHQFGAELFVDAIQAVGVRPIEAEAWGIDYLSCGSHKWLMGTEGCGFLYVHPARQGALQPRLIGWLSVEDPVDFLLGGRPAMRYDKPVRADATAIEAGAPNALGFAALEAGLAPVLDLGIEEVGAHVQAVHDRLEALFVERGFRSLRPGRAEERSGILSFLPPEGLDLPAFVGALGREGVSVSMPDGRLRLSPHWCSGEAEVEAVTAALSRLGALPKG